MATSRIVCGSCEYQNVIVQAVNMCLDCDEGYCKECSKSHYAHKSSRHHKLVPIDESQEESLHVTAICSEHRKNFDFFCPTHDDFACVRCVSEKHRQCGNVDSIEDAAYNVKSSASFQHLEENLTSTIKAVTEIINSVVENGKSIDEQKTKIVQEIESVKTQMMKRIDEIEANLLAELNSKYKEEKSKLDDSKLLLENCKRNLCDIEEKTKKIIEYSNVQIFLSVRNMVKLLDSENKELRKIADSQININFALKRTSEPEDKSKLSIGEIIVSRKPCKWSDPTSKAAQEINVPASKLFSEVEEKKECEYWVDSRSYEDDDSYLVSEDEEDYRKWYRYEQASFSGTVSRAKILENNKKIKKKWVTCYAELSESDLLFYKGERAATKVPGSLFERLELMIPLPGCQVSKASKYVSSKKNVILLATNFGEEYLIQVDDEKSAQTLYIQLEMKTEEQHPRLYVYEPDYGDEIGLKKGDTIDGDITGIL